MALPKVNIFSGSGIFRRCKRVQRTTQVAHRPSEQDWTVKEMLAQSNDKYRNKLFFFKKPFFSRILQLSARARLLSQLCTTSTTKGGSACTFQHIAPVDLALPARAYSQPGAATCRIGRA